MKNIFLASGLVFLLSACAGVSEHHKAEKDALKDLHKADALVTRKKIKLSLATAASAAAIANVVKSTDELKKAKDEKKVAEDTLCHTLELCEVQ